MALLRVMSFVNISVVCVCWQCSFSLHSAKVTTQRIITLHPSLLNIRLLSLTGISRTEVNTTQFGSCGISCSILPVSFLINRMIACLENTKSWGVNSCLGKWDSVGESGGNVGGNYMVGKVVKPLFLVSVLSNIS